MSPRRQTRGKRFDIRVLGLTEATRSIDLLGERASDVRAVARRVRRVYLESEQRRFAKEGPPRWPALAASTLRRKQRQHEDPRTLRASGALFESLTSTSGADQIDQHGRDEFRFGTTIPYAHWHEQGRGVLKRELIKLRPPERRAITDALAAFISEGET